MPFSQPTSAARQHLGWLLLVVVLPLLCLAGCTSRMSRSPATARSVATAPSPTPPVATFTPVPTPSPTFTPTSTPIPTPTLWPTPTATLSPTPTPSLTQSGTYDNLAEHASGRYALQLSGARVAATFATSRSPVQHWAREVPQPLFTVPEPFRPPYPVLRTAEGMSVHVDGAPDPDHLEPRRFLLRVEPDGTVRYVDDDHVEGVGYLAYALDTVWGTTPAANDHAVLQILDAHWFGKTVLSAHPSPVQREIPAHQDHWGWQPARMVGSYVTLNAAGRVTVLGSPVHGTVGERLLVELGELHHLQELNLQAGLLLRFTMSVGNS